MNRIIDIDGNTELLNLPVVKFPPFKLRALLIEKDPVVWLHLIETYVQYCQFLMDPQHMMIEHIDDATLDHIRIFVRSYLQQMSLDVGQILSLGINNDVDSKLIELKRWLLYMITECGLMHLQIFGECLWDMIRIFSPDNTKILQKLLLGEIIPTINVPKTQINKIPQLQKYLKQRIESNKFNRIDLKTLQTLLKTNNSNAKSKFNDEFLTLNWLENLELWWSKGEGKYHELAKQLCLATLLSVSEGRLINFIKDELNLENLNSLLYYPLFGSIIINTNFAKWFPNLLNELPYLNLFPVDTPQVNKTNEQDIQSLKEFFPHISSQQAILLLNKYDNNVELITNELLEIPDLLNTLETSQNGIEENSEEELNNIEDEQDLQLLPNKTRNIDNATKEIIRKHVPDEIKNRTLTRALKLLYDDNDNDNDELDDTYDESMVELNRTNMEKLKLDTSNEDAEEQQHKKNREEQIESHLWELLKQDKSIFARDKRGTNGRKQLKKQITWSDEQIEGWARMLERSPQRARLLEEKYMFKGNQKTGKTSYVKNDSTTHGPPNSPSSGQKSQQQSRKKKIVKTRKDLHNNNKNSKRNIKKPPQKSLSNTK